MMRSLFSGVAGLKTHQTKMDVIGNNIANVNTVAYKSQNVTFQELMYQTTQSASAANAETGRGGINAKQIGLGVQTGAINANISTSGASQTTGNPFDVQIKGDSFFIVSDGSNNYFTRAGAFYVDGMGNLAMTSNGYTVMGWQEDPNKPGTIIKDTVSALKIMSPENRVSSPEQTRKSYLSGVIDKNSTQLTSTNGMIVNVSLYDNLGYSYVAKFSIKQRYDGATPPKPVDGAYDIKALDIVNSQGYSLMHASDEEGYEKNGYDLSGETEPLILQIEDNNDPAHLHAAAILQYDTTNGKSKNVDDNGNEKPFSLQVVKGKYTPATATEKAKIEVADNPAKRADSFGEDMDLMVGTSTMYDNKGTSTIKGNSGDYEGNYAGRKVGEMSGVAIAQDGKITATYDNGTSKLLGQIAVANFANPSGLEKIGDNLYQSTPNSGAFDGIGEDITAGAGSLSTGVLEMSNVDLSAEFTDMITTQRGFQANSSIITVSDSRLEELTNLKR